MHMWDDVSRRDMVAARQLCRETGRPVHGGGLSTRIAKFTDLDPDTLSIADAPVVGVIALLRRKEMLDRFPIINAKVPDDPAGPAESRIVSAPLAFDGKVTGILRRRGTHVLGGMNRKITRPHRPGDEATVHVGRQERPANPR